ncbi:hypothetical protein SAMN05216285_1118 [Natrinema salifodinae]|uniref:Uncharacterized protein n=2 Tax=Natrinema salifodinae TaxID=1202768 RepID=A0A1I0MMJ3_9EURY|nr:hypothetical protein SAMN05216285_1118 [Natrinema salifodinae]
MTNSTATGDRGLLETRFSMGATAVAAIAALVGLAFGWMGYNDGMLPVVGELGILTGVIGLLFGLGIAVVAFVAAVYMEPGFGE